MIVSTTLRKKKNARTDAIKLQRCYFWKTSLFRKHIQHSLRNLHGAFVKKATLLTKVLQKTNIPTKIKKLSDKKTKTDGIPSVLDLLHVVLFLEFVNASACIYKLLFACKVGVALVANFYLDYVCVFGRSRFERCATSTYNSRFVIIGMYTLFHVALPRLIYFGSILPCVLCYCTMSGKIRQAFAKEKLAPLDFDPNTNNKPRRNRYVMRVRSPATVLLLNRTK